MRHDEIFHVVNQYQAKNTFGFSDEEIEKAMKSKNGELGKRYKVQFYLNRPLDAVHN